MNYKERYKKEIQKHRIDGIDNYISLIKNYWKWKKHLQQGITCLDLGIPWMGYGAIDFLNRKLKKNMTVFEYGSGGSSIFFLDRVKKLFTVEHDQKWLESISNLIGTKTNSSNWEGKLILPEKITQFEQKKISNPNDYISNDENSIGFSFETYVREIEHFPNGSFDLVSIDGRARTSCLLYSMGKVKKGGFLLLDNSDREYYTDFIESDEVFQQSYKVVLSKWMPTPSVKIFTKTTIWQKIK